MSPTFVTPAYQSAPPAVATPAIYSPAYSLSGDSEVILTDDTRIVTELTRLRWGLMEAFGLDLTNISASD